MNPNLKDLADLRCLSFADLLAIMQFADMELESVPEATDWEWLRIYAKESFVYKLNTIGAEVRSHTWH